MNLPNTKDIFCEALELSGTERHAYLDRMCGVDGPLRDRVLALLSAAERGGAFLSATVMELDTQWAASRSEEDVGASIGLYNLVELIGEGGFGSVFKAVQTLPVHRVVALKVIKLGMDTSSVVARFEQERQALAIMDHPHIAKVLDAGATRSGRPYFVMEMVEGSAITAYSDANALSIPQRLDLFIQVCHAVQHAHTKGVIHRDIKPSNVLVTTSDEGPFARVIDFGVAKATQTSLNLSATLTGQRQFVGTPQYMSPEQACGSIDVDTRSDVYSLGVVLYELLTGSTPLDPAALRSAGLVEMQRMLTEVEPLAPSTALTCSSNLSVIAAMRHAEPARLSSLLQGELDWVVMRALEKDRSRRYSSPDELAKDLLRHMNGEAVMAAPLSRRYRLRKAVARHRIAVSAAIAVVVAVGVGSGTALWQASVADRERQEAIRSRTLTEQVASFQVEQLRGLDPSVMGDAIRRGLIEGYQSRLDDASLTPQERAAKSQGFKSVLDEANFTDVAMQTLEATMFDRTIQAIREQFSDQPLVQAQLFLTTAETMRNMGLIKASYAPLSEALEIRRSVVGLDDPLSIEVLVSMGRLHWMSGSLDKAEVLVRDATERADRVLGRDSDLACDALDILGLIYQSRSKLTECEAILTDVLERRRRALGSEHVDTVRSLANMARFLAVRGHTAESDAMHQEALARFLTICGPEHKEVVALKMSYAIVLRQQKRAKESEAMLRSVLETRLRTHGESHPETLATLNHLGLTLKVQGRLAEAEVLYRQSLGGFKRVLGSSHSQTLNTMSNLAALLAVTQRPAESELLYREALAGNEIIAGVASLPASIIRHDLAQLLQQEGRYSDAEALFLKAQSGIEESVGASTNYHSSLLHALANLYEAWDAKEPGKGHDRKAREARDKASAARGR